MKPLVLLMLPLFVAWGAQAQACTGNRLQASGDCSNAYLQCLHGNQLPRNCPNGLYFNVDKQYCDFKENVATCMKKVAVQEVVELRLVTDVQVMKNYINDYGYGQAQAKKVLENDTTVIIYEVNEQLRSLKPRGLNVVVRTKKLDVQASDVLFKGKQFFNGSLLLARRAYDRFREWSNQDAAANKESYDMSLLWTGHNLYHNVTGQNINSIIAVSAICTKESSSVFHADSTQETVWKILVAVLRNLGVRRDLRTLPCMPKDLTSVRGFDPRSPLKMTIDDCSLKLINATLAQLNNDNNNCLLKTTTKENKIDITTFYGNDIFKASKICDRAVSYRERHLPMGNHVSQDPLKNDNVCQFLSCATRSGSAIRVSPTEGMTCDQGKRCDRGKCTSSNAK